MPLLQITNTINIRTIGLPANTDIFSFNILDNNSDYYFDSSFANDVSDAPFKYIAPCAKDVTRQINSTLNVMRLAADRRTPKLLIFNETAGVALYPTGMQTGDLIELIQTAYPQNDFDETLTYDIDFLFENDDAIGFTLTITINGWQVRYQDDVLY
jgi:hypothetical protein